MSREGNPMCPHCPSQDYPPHCCTSTHCPHTCCQEEEEHSSCNSNGCCSPQPVCESCSHSCPKTCYSPGNGPRCCHDGCKCNKNGNDYSFYPHSAEESMSNETLSCEPISEEDCCSNTCHSKKWNLSNESLKCNVSCSPSTSSNHHPHAMPRKGGLSKRNKRRKMVRNKVKSTLSRLCGVESPCNTEGTTTRVDHNTNTTGTTLVYGDADRTTCSPQTDATECCSSTVVEAVEVDSEGDARLCGEAVPSNSKETRRQSLNEIITLFRNAISRVSHCASSKQAMDSGCVVQVSIPKLTSKEKNAEMKKREMQQMIRDDRLFREIIGFPCAGNTPCKNREETCCVAPKDSMEIIGNASHCSKNEIENKKKCDLRGLISLFLTNSSRGKCKDGEVVKKCTCTPAEKEKKRKKRQREEDRILREIIGFPFEFITACPVVVVSNEVPKIVMG